MERIVKELYVESVSKSGTFIRVVADFWEGGGTMTNQQRNKVNFLASAQPKVGQRLIMTIEEEKRD